MKEIEPLEKSEKETVAEIKKQKQFLTSRLARPGMKVWEINVNTLEITEAKYSNPVIEMRMLSMPQLRPPKIVPHAVKEIIRNENCAYYPASNKKNALRKYERDKKLFEHGV